jgi:NhaA family Na+:H+ antiporter
LDTQDTTDPINSTAGGCGAGQKTLRADEKTNRSHKLPPSYISQILHPFQEFLEKETSGGILLLFCAVTAMVWANSPWRESYASLWHTELSIGLGSFVFSRQLHFWINDGLMTIFFFVVGLEIKRELLVGELASPRKAALPIVAALGGMLVPAGIYSILNFGTPGAPGWAIPMATDIAFAIGVLALLGDKVPLALKVFLVALAIADDIGAVLVIALFYTSEISWISLLFGAGLLGVLAEANRVDIRRPLVYVFLGSLLWFAFLKSGVHATLSGVVLAMTIPARARINAKEFSSRGRDILERFERAGDQGESILTNAERQALLQSLEKASEQAETPMQRLQRALHPWVTFVIMPVFALANAGVALEGALSKALIQPVGLGVFLGLLLGKQVGITLFAWLSVRIRIAAMPARVSWRQIYGAGWLGGIGFTMSLFIANLAFGESPLLRAAKVGIFSASIIAGVAGWLLLSRSAHAGSEEPRASRGAS